MEYKPRKRRKGINPKFGYFVSPLDPNVLIPDPKKIEALEYAFKMRAKYKTPIRDCCQWLHSACGQLITPAGFHLAYKRWAKELNTQRKKEITIKKREIVKKMEETHDAFKIVTQYDAAAVASMAYNKAKKEVEKTQ